MEKIAKTVKKLNFDPKITEEIAIENEHEIWANTMHSRGLEQGKLEIAKNMLMENIELPIIARVTGLNINKIESLR